MELRLYNNLHRRLEAFQPLDPERVTMYLCGPTVYDYVHIGNARGPVVFDVLVRLLRRRYPNVVYARNITDVDDKINAAASALGVPISTITDKFTTIYREDMARLGVVAPDIEPHATAHMPQIIVMIEQLIASGHAYAADGHVLFSVPSFPDYGQLSRRSVEDMIAGARVEVAPYKKDAADFVLWKPSTPDLPGWDSPWGLGRPGWHIECSAMAEAHLGETIDIHAGGVDLQFPHHENEVAQSTCAHGGKVFARFWVHNGMLNFGGAKMSKSLGNVSVLHQLLEQHPPEALRLALLSAHYMQPLNWSKERIDEGVSRLNRLYGTLRDLGDVTAFGSNEVPPEIEAALCDDLNTPIALAELSNLDIAASRHTAMKQQLSKSIEWLRRWKNEGKELTIVDAKVILSQQVKVDVYPQEVAELLSSLLETGPISPIDFLLSNFSSHLISINEVRRITKEKILSAGGALGILQQPPAAWFSRGVNISEIDRMIDERSEAKRLGDFDRADAIRNTLADQGVVIEDTPQGSRWRIG